MEKQARELIDAQKKIKDDEDSNLGHPLVIGQAQRMLKVDDSAANAFVLFKGDVLNLWTMGTYAERKIVTLSKRSGFIQAYYPAVLLATR